MNLLEFIDKNELDFTGSGSDLNGNCVVLAGYALHKGFTSPIDVSNEIRKDPVLWTESLRRGGCERVAPARGVVLNEFDRVFTYAKNNNYGDYWKTEDAREKYHL